MATYNNIKKIKIGDNIFNLPKAVLSMSFTGGVNSFDYSYTTTEGVYSDTVTITTSITKAMVTGALGTGSGTAKFLREDGSWAVPAYIANTDTKDTTGTTNKTGTKMYLAAATSQAGSTVTYSNSNCYIGTDNCLYSGGSKVLTSHQDISGKIDTAGSGLSKSGTTLNHASSITAGTVGTSSATSGTTLAVPYVTYNATGHITGTGTHTHTITNASTSAAGLMSKDDKAKLDNMANYVIEQGTSGIWTYRKWSDGTAECWANVVGSWSASFTQMVSGTFSHASWNTKSEALPTNLFTSVTYANVNAVTNAYTSTQVAGLNTTTVTFRLWNSYVSTVTIYSYQLHVKGTWK